MNSFWQDLRLGWRKLAQAPGFAAVVIVTLALGIGANAIVLSWIRSVLLDAVPGAAAAERLVVLCTRQANGEVMDTTSVLDNRDLAQEQGIFAGVTGSMFDVAPLVQNQETAWLWAEWTTANFFEVLGVKPWLGRFFLTTEDQNPGADNVVVLSHALWRERFGSDPGIVGQTVEIATRSFTVIGVAPPEFRGGMGGLNFDFWAPLTMTPEYADPRTLLTSRGIRPLHTYARLQPGVSQGRAQAAANAVMARLEQEYPNSNKGMSLAVLPVWKSPWGGQSVFLPLLRALGILSLLLWLLVVANVANLLLARANRRQQEIAVRLALGAARHRLIRQLLTESVLLAGLGGTLGLVLAFWGEGLLVRLMPTTHLPIGYDMQPNGMIAGITAGFTLFTGLLFGLAPALFSLRADLTGGLKQGGARGSQTAGVPWLRSGLVVAEIALALVMLAGMALCARSLEGARQIDFGFDPGNTWLTGYRLPPVGYDDAATLATFGRLRQALTEIPGVESVALADWIPLGFEGGGSTRFAVDGYQPTPGEPMSANIATVSPGYFDTMRIPILNGREFAESDDREAPRTMVVNAAFAERYFGTRHPLGLKVRLWGQEWTIVGVAKTGKYRALNEPARSFIYVPERQVADRSLTAIVRTTGDPQRLARAIEQASVAVDPMLKPMAALSLRDYTSAALAVPRVAATLLTATGAIALFLAALGIYGVMSFSVGQRTREIGVRMALGAQPGDVLRLFLGQGMKLAGAGLLFGLAGAMATGSMLASVLVGVSPTDPLSHGFVVAGLAIICFLATYLPSRRAALVNPLVALRQE